MKPTAHETREAILIGELATHLAIELDAEGGLRDIEVEALAATVTARLECAVLLKLLIDKGIVTHDEYMAAKLHALAVEVNRTRARAEVATQVRQLTHPIGGIQ